MTPLTKNSIYQFFHNYSGVILLFIFLLSEAIGKFLIDDKNEPMLIGKVIKGLISAVLLVFLVKKSKKKVIQYIVLPLSFFLLGYFFLGAIPNPKVMLVFFKYLFPILLFFFFEEYITSKKPIDYFLKAFEVFIIFNTVLIIIGLAFEIEDLKTYNRNRFGYNGLIQTSAASTYIYLIAEYYFLNKILRKNFDKTEVMNFILVFIGALLVGTKTLYLGGAFIIGLFAWNFYKKRFRKWILFMLSTIVLTAGYYFFYSSKFFGSITQKEGFITSFLSYRDELFKTKTYPFIEENWDIGNFLFGGILDITTRTQMSFIDLFYFWGIIGGIYYLYVFYNSYFTFKISRNDIAFFAFLCCAIFIAGNFFIYTIVPIFLMVIKSSNRRLSII